MRSGAPMATECEGTYAPEATGRDAGRRMSLCWCSGLLCMAPSLLEARGLPEVHEAWLLCGSGAADRTCGRVWRSCLVSGLRGRVRGEKGSTGEIKRPLRGLQPPAVPVHVNNTAQSLSSAERALQRCIGPSSSSPHLPEEGGGGGMDGWMAHEGRGQHPGTQANSSVLLHSLPAALLEFRLR